MSNNFRRKITDLPVCNDVNELDTLIGLGVDGNTYRVDKTIIPSSGGGSNHEYIVYNNYAYIDGGIVLSLGSNDVDMNNYATKGGILHIILAYESGGTKICKDFPAVLSMNAYRIYANNEYGIHTIHDFSPGLYLTVELYHFLESNEVECFLCTCDESGNFTEDVQLNSVIVGVYFEHAPGLEYTPSLVE